MVDHVGGTLMKGVSGLTKAIRGLALSLSAPFQQSITPDD